jgi:hypothetical protein
MATKKDATCTGKGKIVHQLIADGQTRVIVLNETQAEQVQTEEGKEERLNVTDLVEMTIERTETQVQRVIVLKKLKNKMSLQTRSRTEGGIEKKVKKRPPNDPIEMKRKTERKKALMKKVKKKKESYQVEEGTEKKVKKRPLEDHTEMKRLTDTERKRVPKKKVKMK